MTDVEIHDPHRTFGDEGSPALLVLGAGGGVEIGQGIATATERGLAIRQLCFAARQLGSVGGGVELSIHDLPRPAFDALPVAAIELPGVGAWTKTIPLSDEEYIRVTVYTREPPADPDVDWFEIARLITAAPADET